MDWKVGDRAFVDGVGTGTIKAISGDLVDVRFDAQNPYVGRDKRSQVSLDDLKAIEGRDPGESKVKEPDPSPAGDILPPHEPVPTKQ